MSVPTLTTNDPLVSPVTAQELADFLRADISDPLLSPMLTAATESVISFTKRDLIVRAWKLIYWDWPKAGKKLCNEIKLLNATSGNETTVSQVLINGEVDTSHTLRNDSIYFEYLSVTSDPEVKALEIDYTTGYANAAAVPQAIKEAIKLIASYLYTNRGCSAKEALHSSGAAVILAPYRSAESLL